MHPPPFKLVAAHRLLQEAASPAPAGAADERFAGAEAAADTPAPPFGEAPGRGRARLAELDPHLHCSVIGTCLGTVELRKLMTRFLVVRDGSDLEVHHEAVSLATRGGAVAKALGKALDKRHAATLQRFDKAHDAAAVEAMWDDALTRGEVPGAYWAVLTHRDATPGLRQRVFGDIHMLSHLVASANLADIRRQTALERENAELRDRVDRQQQRLAASLDECQQIAARLDEALAGNGRPTAAADVDLQEIARLRRRHDEAAEGAARAVALQTERRERAEQAATGAVAEATRLREELDHLARHVRTLARELDAAETQLREFGDPDREPSARALAGRLQGRRVFYVGGRPSSVVAIRDLVVRHGGEFQRHDGGFEDRKGLLASGIAWAELVVFPVDCVDHDSAENLKRLCHRQQVAYLPLRSASVTSFTAALAESPDASTDGRPAPPCCRRHG